MSFHAIWECFVFACRKWSFSKVLWDESIRIYHHWKCYRLLVRSDLKEKDIFDSLRFEGTIEKSNEAEEEVYETINISKIRAQTPNLRVCCPSILRLIIETFRSSISTEFSSLMTIISMSLHRVASISNVYHWISVHVSKVQVLKIFYNVVKNYNVYFYKILVNISEIIEFNHHSGRFVLCQ